MTHRSLATASVALGLLSSLAGCDLLGLLPSLQPEAAEDGQDVRLQPGDHWTFTERRTVVSDDPQSVLTANLNMTVTDQTVTDLVGATALVVTTEGSGGPEGETPTPFSSAAYYSRGEDGAWYLHGDTADAGAGEYMSFVLAEDGGKFRVKPCPLVVGATYEWDVSYDDGYRTWGSSHVVGYEQVTTPAGDFMATRIETERQDVLGEYVSRCTSTRWHVAGLHNGVKTIASCHDDSPEGPSDYTVETELTDSNLLHEAP